METRIMFGRLNIMGLMNGYLILKLILSRLLDHLFKGLGNCGGKIFSSSRCMIRIIIIASTNTSYQLLRLNFNYTLHLASPVTRFLEPLHKFSQCQYTLFTYQVLKPGCYLSQLMKFRGSVGSGK
jgi:hypothetical protein